MRNENMKDAEEHFDRYVNRSCGRNVRKKFYGIKVQWQEKLLVSYFALVYIKQ